MDRVPHEQPLDIAIIGAGAAGLMAGIAAGRTARERGRSLRITAFDGARKIGAKILVAGGGRCNVTHHEVTERAFAGGSPNAIRKVLRRFDAARTVDFFADLGVVLKREETGKLFPITDDARTVLNALLGAARDAGVEIRHPARIERVSAAGEGFLLAGPWGSATTRRLVLATGGMALPKSGSDGGGYELARSLGHSITPRVFPALVPLVLAPECFLRSLSGLTISMRIELRSGTGKRLQSFTDSTLCTHFGVSGPSVMDISRYYTAAKLDDPAAHLVACWLPDLAREEADGELRGLGKRSVGRWVRERLPDRLAAALCEGAGIEPGTRGSELTREARRALLDALYQMRLPVTGDRGFTHAEVTAVGVPLGEITIGSMASKRCDGLFLCGEVCDVDGRIGRFNFQWAWASGHIAGSSAAAAPAD
jgi:predicted Rossmann fold flavoprotein